MFEGLRELKRDSVLKVFDAVIKRKNTSRTVISQDTGLSFVTVSKIIDSFIEEDIFKQSHTNKCAILKRKSRLISAKQKYWVGIFDIRSTMFSFSVFDLNSSCIKSISKEPEESIFIDDVLRRFIMSAEKFVQEQCYISSCCGIGVLVPGNYDPVTDKVTDSEIPHLGVIKIKEFFSNYTYGHIPYVASLYTSFANELSLTLPDDHSALTLFLDKNCVKTAYALPDRLGTLHVKDLGSLMATPFRRFSSVVRSVPDPDDLFPGLSEILYVLISTLNITDIIVAGYLYSEFSAVPPVLRDYLGRLCADNGATLPAISTADLMKSARKNISREMWRKWMLETVLYEDNIT